jgi:site-specific DNA-methyltransferase (adenine-specific)
MSHKHFRRTLLASTSRAALHRAWAAFNQGALAIIEQEERAAFAQALAAKDEPPAGADKPTLAAHPARNIAQQGDALDLLTSLPDACAAAVFFDPQHRGVLDKLAYGNEGARQVERCNLPQMSADYIDACSREIGRVLASSAYCFRWVDTFGLCEAHHRRVADCLTPVDLIAWDKRQMGMGYRSRRCGDYLLVLQKPPLRAKATWSDKGIPDRWPEKVDRKIHPHVKPAGLIERLIGAVTLPGDLVIDPAAGSFVVMHAAMRMGRTFIGCDIRQENGADRTHDSPYRMTDVAIPGAGTLDIPDFLRGRPVS